MITRDPGAPFDTPNVVIGRQGRNELTLSFRPAPYLARRLDKISKGVPALKERKNNAHTLLAHSYVRSQPGCPRARHGELTPRWPRVRELPPPPLAAA